MSMKMLQTLLCIFPRLHFESNVVQFGPEKRPAYLEWP